MKKNNNVELLEIERVKTFLRSMDIFELTPKQRSKYLKDKRLSLLEKQILHSALELKDCKFEKIIKTLLPSITSNKLIQAQRDMVLGIAFNNSGQADKAIPYFRKASHIFQHFQLNNYAFNSYLFLFFSFLNMKKNSELEKILDQLEETVGDRFKNKISLVRCRFNYYMQQDNYAKAKTSLEWLDQHRNEMHNAQLVYHLVDKFIFFMKQDKFDECSRTLREMKVVRRYSLSANYKFMKALTDHIAENKPIYLYDKDFEKYPQLFYQLKIIQSLGSGEDDVAQSFWTKLVELQPHIYKGFMDYRGDKSLFSICLNKYQDTSNVHQIELNLSVLGQKEKELVLMLQRASGPVKKEQIIQKIWKTNSIQKDDLFKLSMMVSRIKRKLDIDIKTQKGAYILIHSAKKRAS